VPKGSAELHRAEVPVAPQRHLHLTKRVAADSAGAGAAYCSAAVRGGRDAQLGGGHVRSAEIGSVAEPSWRHGCRAGGSRGRQRGLGAEKIVVGRRSGAHCAGAFRPAAALAVRVRACTPATRFRIGLPRIPRRPDALHLHSAFARVVVSLLRYHLFRDRSGRQNCGHALEMGRQRIVPARLHVAKPAESQRREAIPERELGDPRPRVRPRHRVCRKAVVGGRGRDPLAVRRSREHGVDTAGVVVC